MLGTRDRQLMQKESERSDSHSEQSGMGRAMVKSGGK